MANSLTLEDLALDMDVQCLVRWKSKGGKHLWFAKDVRPAGRARTHSFFVAQVKSVRYTFSAEEDSPAPAPSPGARLATGARG